MVMFTCNNEGWEWEGPERGSDPEKVWAGFQSWQPERAALEGSPESIRASNTGVWS
jgi:hypothetical protein